MTKIDKYSGAIESRLSTCCALLLFLMSLLLLRGLLTKDTESIVSYGIINGSRHLPLPYSLAKKCVLKVYITTKMLLIV